MLARLFLSSHAPQACLTAAGLCVVLLGLLLAVVLDALNLKNSNAKIKRVSVTQSCAPRASPSHPASRALNACAA